MGKLILLPYVILLTAAAPANSASAVNSQIAPPADAQQTVPPSGGRASAGR